MTTASAPTATSGPLVLADMSGYTAFLQDVALAHRDDAFADGQVPEAYGILTRLLDGIVGKLVPPYTLSKLEGDATVSGNSIMGLMMLAAAPGCQIEIKASGADAAGAVDALSALVDARFHED